MASPTSPVNPFTQMVNKRLGGDEYVIEGELAKGAVWRVFKSKRLIDSKYVAIKEALTVNIRQDVEILTRCIGHDNVVQLIRACRDDKDKQKSPLYTYLITELCSIDLPVFLRDLGGRLPSSQLCIAAKHLADGYLVLYNNGILHKNISSKNILVYFLGNHAILKISGFNCAVTMPEKPSFIKRSLSITGRAQYMAPEIGRAFVKSKRTSTEYSPKSDLWSLGILLCEMALGKFPFTSGTLLELFKSPRQQKVSISFESLNVPEFESFCSLIRGLLRVNVDERPDPPTVCKDACFVGLEPKTQVFIANDQINDAMRLYDLYWTLPAPVPSAPIAVVRVRDYEYNEMTEVGKGSFGKVWRAKRLTDGVKVALKQVHKEDVDLAEIETMQTVVHPNLLKMIDHFEQYPYMYIITELCSCDLSTFLKSKFSDDRLRDESDARILSRHLSSGYMAMKSAEILHRDIKPTNVLVSMDADGGALFKLADFGCSKSMTHVEYAQTVLGTPFYMAPELGACLYLQIDNAHYDHRADIWSMGLIVFLSLNGRLPFAEADLLRLCYDVGTGQPTDYYQDDLRQQMGRMDISAELSDLLNRSLFVDYTRRMTAADFFQHQFHSHLPLTTRLHLSSK